MEKLCHAGILSIPDDCDAVLSGEHQGGIFMSYKEELMRKIQAQRRFLDELLLDMANFQEPVPEPVEVRQVPEQQNRLMRAKEVQAYQGS
jgi:hypothetical protein